MLTDDSINEYKRRGWVVVSDVFAPHEVDPIADLALQIGAAELERAKENYLVDRSSNGQVAIRKIEYPFRKSEVFRAFATQPRVAALVSELMGVPALLCYDAIFMKPPRVGFAKPYHQDNAYFCCRPPDHVITAWIALDDVDEENGCLRYIDGSHETGMIEHRPLAGESHNIAAPLHLIDFIRESLAIVKKGGVVFHHVETLHGSHRNESSRWRRGYVTQWVGADVISDTNVLSKAYFRDAT